jgi:hypothetical protein
MCDDDKKKGNIRGTITALKFLAGPVAEEVRRKKYDCSSLASRAKRVAKIGEITLGSQGKRRGTDEKK